jgi:hypothetical protein
MRITGDPDSQSPDKCGVLLYILFICKYNIII